LTIASYKELTIFMQHHGIYGFTSHLRIFHSHGDVTITGDGLQNFGLSLALRAFEQGGSLSCHTCYDTGPRFFRSHPKDRPIQSPLRHTRGCGGSILTRILTGLIWRRLMESLYTFHKNFHCFWLKQCKF
jgi:hypothetical protein